MFQPLGHMEFECYYVFFFFLFLSSEAFVYNPHIAWTKKNLFSSVYDYLKVSKVEVNIVSEKKIMG